MVIVTLVPILPGARLKERTVGPPAGAPESPRP
jgi:hypothetical protein